jgi:hypothetical protein
MTDRIRIRKEAYHYIVEQLNTLHAEVTRTGWMESVPLEELRLLKEGQADPSATLVALLKDQFKGLVNDLEIDSHLVEPFNNHL